MLVRDLTDGQDLDQVLLVRACEPRTRRDGTPLLKLSLGDRSGRVGAVVRDPGPELRELCQVGRAVHVRGRYELHPQRKQRTKSSPKWFAPVMVALMVIGIGIIVWNFFRNNGSSFDPGVMWLGLGVLAAGFFGISFWK